MHVGWVPDGTGGYRGQLAALVKPNGRFGAAYMAAIKPFRRLLVYPALLRSIERDWKLGRRAREGGGNSEQSDAAKRSSGAADRLSTRPRN